MTSTASTTGTSGVNGPLWSAAAEDWSQIQEGQFRPGYEAVLQHCGVGPGVDYLDAGCGSGMAAAIAAERGARACLRACFISRILRRCPSPMLRSTWSPASMPSSSRATRCAPCPRRLAARAKGLIGAEAVDAAHRAALAPFRQADGSFRIGASCRFLVARA